MSLGRGGSHAAGPAVTPFAADGRHLTGWRATFKLTIRGIGRYVGMSASGGRSSHSLAAAAGEDPNERGFLGTQRSIFI